MSLNSFSRSSHWDLDYFSEPAEALRLHLSVFCHPPINGTAIEVGKGGLPPELSFIVLKVFAPSRSLLPNGLLVCKMLAFFVPSIFLDTTAPSNFAGPPLS